MLYIVQSDVRLLSEDKYLHHHVMLTYRRRDEAKSCTVGVDGEGARSAQTL